MRLGETSEMKKGMASNPGANNGGCAPAGGACECHAETGSSRSGQAFLALAFGSTVKMHLLGFDLRLETKAISAVGDDGRRGLVGNAGKETR